MWKLLTLRNQKFSRKKQKFYVKIKQVQILSLKNHQFARRNSEALKLASEIFEKNNLEISKVF